MQFLSYLSNILRRICFVSGMPNSLRIWAHMQWCSVIEHFNWINSGLTAQFYLNRMHLKWKERCNENKRGERGRETDTHKLIWAISPIWKLCRAFVLPHFQSVSSDMNETDPNNRNTIWNNWMHTTSKMRNCMTISARLQWRLAAQFERNKWNKNTSNFTIIHINISHLHWPLKQRI